MSSTPSQSSTTATGSGELDKKRFRKELRKHNKLAKRSQSAAGCGANSSTTTAARPEAVASLDAIAHSSSLLGPSLRKEIQRVWDAARADEHLASDPSAQTSSLSSTRKKEKEVEEEAVPDHKVGTLEMYKHFPVAYDNFMRRHDCSAVSSYLTDVVLERIVKTRLGSNSNNNNNNNNKAQFMRIADFGCGTGRIETMLADSPHVDTIYAYDGEAEMLKRCLVNTARVAAQGRHVDEVCLLDEPHTSALATSEESKKSVVIASSSPSTSTEANKRTLSIVARPCSFQAIQAGFLSTSQHPPCHLIVCAWSLSYLMRLQWGEARWHAAVDAAVTEMVNLLDNRDSDAALVIIETLGNGCTTPTRRSTLAERLESEHHFERQWVRTDYQFHDVAEAVRMSRFFFGAKVSEGMQKDQATSLPECTGIWTLWKQRKTE